MNAAHVSTGPPHESRERIGRSEAALPGGLELTLAADEHAPMLARRAAGGALASWDPDRREIALLVISELVTNAVRHGSRGARDAVELTVRRTGRSTRIEVRDRAALERTVQPAAPPSELTDARSGWGLPIVAELTDSWGVDQRSGRTSVWCELRDA